LNKYLNKFKKKFKLKVKYLNEDGAGFGPFKEWLSLVAK
jgi:hypothetical protein